MEIERIDRADYTYTLDELNALAEAEERSQKPYSSAERAYRKKMRRLVRDIKSGKRTKNVLHF